MKRFLSCILIFMILVGCLSGCGTSDNKQSSADSVFVKPEKYAAIVNVSINPSFDIYLDEKAIVLGIEPKNEEAKAIDFSSYIGVELKTAIKDLVGVICENTPINRESVVFVEFVEGEDNILEVDTVDIIQSACADAFAQKTVNETMDSVLQVRLEDEYGCKCVDCNNWYERHWYSYPESACVDMEYIEEAYKNYMENWKNGLDSMDKNDPSYALSVKNYENMTIDTFDFKEIRRRQHYAQLQYAEIEHEEKVITYKILYGASSDNGYPLNTEEVTPEKYFEKKPEDRELLTGLEKAVKVDVEVYVNGEKQNNYYRGWLYLMEGKWYSNNGVQFSPGG